MTGDSFGSRLLDMRKAWGFTQGEIADKANVGVRTIRRIENGDGFFPRMESAQRIADVLHVRLSWLVMGEEPMLSLSHMQTEEQHKAQGGPGTEGLPGYVIVGPGPWYTDDEGEWQVDRSATGTKQGPIVALGGHDK